MNFSFWVDFHPKAFRRSWRWLPTVHRSAWERREGGGRWIYVNWSWLNFGGQADNEW